MTLLFGSALIGSGVARADNLGIEMAAVSNGPVVPVVNLVVGEGATTASTSIVLRQPGDQPLPNVALFATVAGKSVGFKAAGSAPGAAFTIPAKGGEVPVTLTADGVTETSGVDDMATLIVTSANRPQPLGMIHLIKAATPIITLDGAVDSKITLPATSDTNFVWQFRIRSSAAAPTPVVIVVSPLQVPDGGQVSPTVSIAGATYDMATPVPVPAKGALAFTISATLTTSGTYTGSITVSVANGSGGGSPLVTQLSVARQRVAPTITIDDIHPVRVTRTFCTGWPRCRPTTVVFNVSVRETGGQRVVVHAPDLAVLLRKDGANEFQIPSPDVTVMVDGKAVTEVELVPDASLHFTVAVANVRGAGEYTATLRFTASQRSDSDKTVSIFVRESLWLAVLLIAVAAVLSAIIRWYRTVAHVHLITQQQVVELMSGCAMVVRAAEPNAPPRQEVARAVWARLQTLLARAGGRGGAAVTDDDVAQERRRVELLGHWLATWRVVERTGDTAHFTELGQVDAALRADALNADVEAARDAQLNAIDAALSGGQAVVASIGALGTDLDSKIASLPVNHPRRADLVAWRRELTAAAATAGGNVSGAAATLGTVSTRWTDYLIDQLEGQVGAVAPPLGLKAGQWVALQARVWAEMAAARQSSDLNQKQGHYQTGATILVQGLASGLQHRMNSKALVVEARLNQMAAGAERQQAETLVTSLNDLVNQARAAGDLATRNKLREAQVAYDGVLAGYQALAPLLQAQGQQLAGGGGAAGAAAEQIVASPAPGGPSPVSSVAVQSPTLPPAPSKWRRRIQMYIGDVSVTIVVLGVAVLLGIKLLYDPAPAWGTWQDQVTALLWGFGLHQVGTGGAFQGLAKLQSTIGEAPA